ncbi:MAG: hypothetical protein AAB660_01605 [Patescibacteria group bacterium]|mgnify:CR=1 FL=1
MKALKLLFIIGGMVEVGIISLSTAFAVKIIEVITTLDSFTLVSVTIIWILMVMVSIVFGYVLYIGWKVYKKMPR